MAPGRDMRNKARIGAFKAKRAGRRLGEKAKGAVRMAGEAAGAIDDAVQGRLRDVIVGPGATKTSEVHPARMLASWAGGTWNRPGSPVDTEFKYSDDAQGRAAYIGAKIGQGAGLTAAGIGALAVAQALMPEPEQNPGTLMPDDGLG